jgi:hypothetical protein
MLVETGPVAAGHTSRVDASELQASKTSKTTPDVQRHSGHRFVRRAGGGWRDLMLASVTITPWTFCSDDWVAAAHRLKAHAVQWPVSDGVEAAVMPGQLVLTLNSPVPQL